MILNICYNLQIKLKVEYNKNIKLSVKFMNHKF